VAYKRRAYSCHFRQLLLCQVQHSSRAPDPFSHGFLIHAITSGMIMPHFAQIVVKTTHFCIVRHK
jgi:hypothetical protein